MAEEIRPGARAEEDKPRTSRGGTRTVRMIEGISGGRHDGQAWPAAGGTIKVPAWEAEELIASRHAVAEGDEPEVHSGETVPATPPPGHVATGRVARGEATAEEVMTGHPADFAAVERAAEEQHGARGDEELRGARHLHPDPRPDSQILAEDYYPEEREQIELGTKALDRAADEPAEVRRKDRRESRKAEAARRAAERNSALRYAAEGGVAGAPGAEVPGLEGAEPVPFAEGVRPETQVEQEAAVRDEEGRDVSEPGLEGMTEEERAEYETRMPGYTAPEEIRDEPVPGQPTLDAPDPGQRFEAAGVGTAETPEGQAGAAAENAGETGTARDAAGAEAATGEGAGEAGRHRVTAESDAPIEVSGDGTAESAQAGEPDAAGEPAAEGEQAGDAPAPSAPKQAWVDYAVSKGADVHAASNSTKADLMSRYGGRL
jgi:hypothetical protein